MLISCEKCSTTYVLDDGLIPPQGAPVQCTRCGHVFTAKLKAAASSRSGRTSRPSGGSAPAASPGPSPNQTIMFGAGEGNGGPAAPSHSSTHPSNPVASKTAPFSGQPSVPHPSPAATPASRTVIFGANAPVPASPAPSARGGGFSAPGAAPSTGTLAFGSPARQTGGRAANPQPAPASQTVIFGSGAPVSVPASASGPANPTPHTTQPFGGGPPGAPPRTTMMFGGAGAQPVAAPASSTASAPSRSTLIFGTDAQPKPPPRVTPGSMKLDVPAKPRVSESTVRVDLQEMMREHGAPDATLPQEDDSPTERPESSSKKDRHRTQPFSPDEPDSTPSDGRDQVQARHNRTQLFAMGAAQETTRPDALYPLQEPTTPGPSGPTLAALAEPMPSNLPPPPGLTPLAIDGVTTLPPDVPLRHTLLFSGSGHPGPTTQEDPPGVSSLLEPGGDPQNLTTPPSVPAAEPVASTLPQLPPIDAPGHQIPSPATASINLPPEPILATNQTDRFDGGVPQRGGTAQFQAVMAETRVQSRRRAAIALIVLLAIVLGLGGALLWKLVVKKLVAGGTPVEAQQAVDAALKKLRKGDSPSNAQAVAALGAAVAKNPGHLEARAGLLLAESLAYDDVHQRMLRMKAAHDALAGDLKRASPDRADQIRARIEALERDYAALTPETNALAQRSDQAFKDLQLAKGSVTDKDPARDLAVLRAEGLYYATSGSQEAIQLAERFHRLGVEDDWGELIFPAYCVNATPSNEARAEALAGIAKVRNHKGNDTFFRAAILAARIDLEAGDTAAAQAELQKVLELSPAHDIAAELKAWLTAHSG